MFSVKIALLAFALVFVASLRGTYPPLSKLERDAWTVVQLGLLALAFYLIGRL